MSRFHEMADHWRERGQERRRTLTPKAEGVPLRIYNWWRDNAENPKVRYNFCHYFWAVVLRAPMLWLSLKLKPVLDRPMTWKIALPLLLVGLIVGSVLGGWFLPLLGSTGGLVYAFAGFVFALLAGGRVFKGNWDLELFEDDNDSRLDYLAVPLGIVFAPFTLVLLLVWVCSAVQGWIERRFGFKLSADMCLLAMFIAVVVAFYVAALINWPIVTLSITGFGLLLVLAGFLRKRKLERLRQENMRLVVEGALRDVFAYLHPDRVDDPEAYNSWKSLYLLHCDDDPEEMYKLVLYHRLPLSEAMPLRTYGFHLSGDAQEAKPPGRTERFFMAIWDFLSLVGTAILVGKWRMCPMMEIPSRDDC